MLSHILYISMSLQAQKPFTLQLTISDFHHTTVQTKRTCYDYSNCRGLCNIAKAIGEGAVEVSKTITVQ